MASTIKLKNGSGAPTAGDLVQGEPALDLTNKRLYTENASGTIIEVGVNPSSVTTGAITATGLDVTGTATMDGLTVDGTGTFGDLSSKIKVGLNGDSISSDADFYIQTSTADPLILRTNFTEAMRIDSSGNVGIGTSSPSSKLHLSGDGDSASKLTVQRTGATVGTAVLGYDYVGSFSNNDFKLFANSTERMRIDSSGNVGIGTNAPSAKLDVELGVDGVIAEFRGGDADIIQIKGASNTIAFDTRNTAALTFEMQGAERMRIDSSGNVGIGTSSPSAGAVGGKVIHVQNSGGTASVRVDRSDAATSGTLSMTSGDGSNGLFSTGAKPLAFAVNSTERMRIDSSGNLLVGTTTAGYASQSGVAVIPDGASYVAVAHPTGASSGNSYALFTYNAGIIGSITQNGTTGVNYNTSSDQRLKENIADADDAGSKIDAIQVRQYDWKADGSHQDYGMIAQELQAVAPEAVSGDPSSDEMMGVDYSKLVPMLIKEIQSLRNRVAQLEEE